MRRWWPAQSKSTLVSIILFGYRLGLLTAGAVVVSFASGSVAGTFGSVVAGLVSVVSAILISWGYNSVEMFDVK